jgi:hypothetical protein
MSQKERQKGVIMVIPGFEVLGELELLGIDGGFNPVVYVQQHAEALRNALAITGGAASAVAVRVTNSNVQSALYLVGGGCTLLSWVVKPWGIV